jgi:peptide deformylase
MALLTILSAPDPRLKMKAHPVEVVDDAVRIIMDNMLETMYTNEGFGLAATQVGIDKRIIVIDLNADNETAPPHVIKLANPEITWQSEETRIEDEACMSVPYVYAPVERPIKVKLRYLDENNSVIEVAADGLFARCIQHEIDHLDGILYIDRISRLKRDILLRKSTKARRMRL